MQADRFTVKSQEAVQSAQQLAAQRHNPEIATPHLLVSLLEQAEGMAVPVLQKVGADPAAVGARANEALAALPTVSDAQEPRMSSNLARALQSAEREMAKLGDSYISVGHLLLALTEDGSGVADLLPDRDALERRSARCRGPARSTPPTPRTTSRRWRNSAAT